MAFNKTKYNNDYNGNNYDRLNIILPKGAKDYLKQYCLSKGCSCNQLVSDCLLWELGISNWSDVIKGKEEDQK